MIKLKDLTISKTKEILLKKEVSCFDLVKEFFDYIEERDKSIGAYLSLRKDEAFREANEIDKKIASGRDIGKLGGVPVAVKDSILVKGHRCTAGSKILENYTASYDATAVEKIKKEGAIILGKTNLDEFSMGSSTETSAFKLTRNPLDQTRSPGGSSGGSAAAVAGHQAVCALGGDTSSSIRQPAAFCGVVGMKPTYGSISRSGLISMTSSLDQVGPIAKNARDAALLFEIMAGRDEKDQSSVENNFKFADLNPANAKKFKVGIIKECFDENLDSDLKETFQESVKLLETLGIKAEEASVPHISQSLACYHILMPAEVSSNLGRYDGLRYSPNEDLTGNLKELYFKHRGGRFGEEARRRIVLGTFVLSAGYCDAYYKKAKKVQRLIKNEFQKAYEKFDILLLPTAPTTAFKIGEKMSDPLEMYRADIFTVPANISGSCAVSLPIYGKEKLPYGLQFMARPLGEKEMFEAALAFEGVYKM